MKNFLTCCLMFVCLVSVFSQVDKTYGWVSGSGAPTHTPNLNYDSEKYWDYTNMKAYCYDRFNNQWEIDQDHPPVSISGLSNPALSSSGVNSQILMLDLNAGSSYNNSAACSMTATSIQAAIDELSCRTASDAGDFLFSIDGNGDYLLTHKTSSGMKKDQVIPSLCSEIESLPSNTTPGANDLLTTYNAGRDECSSISISNIASFINSGATDLNYAETDLTFTGDRTHDAAGFDLTLNNFLEVLYTNASNFFLLGSSGATIRNGSGATQSQVALVGGNAGTSSLKSGNDLVIDVGGDLRILEDTWSSTPDNAPLLKQGSIVSGDNFYANYALPAVAPTTTNTVLTYDGTSVIWGEGYPTIINDSDSDCVDVSVTGDNTNGYNISSEIIISTDPDNDLDCRANGLYAFHDFHNKEPLQPLTEAIEGEDEVLIYDDSASEYKRIKPVQWSWGILQTGVGQIQLSPLIRQYTHLVISNGVSNIDPGDAIGQSVKVKCILQGGQTIFGAAGVLFRTGSSAPTGSYPMADGQSIELVWNGTEWDVYD